MLKRALGAALALALFAAPAAAQSYHDSGGTTVPGFVPIQPGVGPLFTTANPGQISGSFSASISGFQPTPSYSYQSVTTSSAAYALPSGTVDIFYNTGSNPITVKLGSSSVSVASGQADVIQPSSWMAFTAGSATYYAVIGNGGSSTVVVSGGSGLPTGAGGGGGSGGGGNVNVTQFGGSSVSLGQQTAANSLPVILPSATITTLTPPTTITANQGTANSTPWNENLSQYGGSAVGAGNAFYVQPGTGATFPVSGNVGISGTPSVSISGTPNVGVTSEIGYGSTGSAVPPAAVYNGMNVGGNLVGLTGTANGLKVDGSAVTQPVSGSVSISGTPTVTANAGSGSFTVAQSTASSLNATVVGAGSAGTPSGGVVSVQGVSGGQPVPISGTVSASIGNFAPTPAYATPLSVSTTSSRVAAPTGTSVVVYNVGTSDAYVTLGNSSVTATTSGDVVKAGGWMQFTLGSNTYVAAITASGTTTLNVSGGAGIAAGSGGASSGGGTVNQGTANSVGNAWPEYLAQGGAAVAAGNGLYVQPGTGATFPVSAATLPLPSGASTAANQTNVQSAPGTSAATALTVQGSASGVAVPVSGAVTATISGTPSVNLGGTLPAFASTPTVNIGGTLPAFASTPTVNVGLQTANGWTPLLANGLSTTVKSIKSSAGQLGVVQCYNPNTAQAYVQIFNVASGSVTLGTTSPAISIPIAPSATGGFAMTTVGFQFSTAISAAATTTATGSTAPSTAIDCNVGYN